MLMSSNKKCIKCNCYRDLSKFTFRKDTMKYRNVCKYCVNDRTKELRKLDPEKFRERNRRYVRKDKNKVKVNSRKWHLKRFFGMSMEDYNKFLDIQEYRCAICQIELTETGKDHFDIDHCHKTGKIRGLLCGSCNKGLGCFKDDINSLESALNYLKED